MKKTLLGLLAFVAFSAFASDVKFVESLEIVEAPSIVESTPYLVTGLTSTKIRYTIDCTNKTLTYGTSHHGKADSLYRRTVSLGKGCEEMAYFIAIETKASRRIQINVSNPLGKTRAELVLFK